MEYDILVIGGGPAGLMAAGTAARKGWKVVLLERMSSPGRKLRITGKGRCNLTNMVPVEEFVSHFGKNGRFLRQAFSQFFNTDLVQFFSQLHVDTTVERGNRVFPKSGSAVEVTNALINWAVNSGVEIRNDARVKNIRINEHGLFEVEVNKDILVAQKVILATGSKSYPLTGSSGDGYQIAESYGHHITALSPSLVPLTSDQPWISQVEGLNLKNVKATLYIDDKKIMSDFGEMEFRDSTVCGPIILSMSGQTVKALSRALPPCTRGDKGGLLTTNIIFSIDLKPALEHDQLDARIIRELNASANSRFEIVLKSLLPIKLIPVCCEMTRLDLNKPCNQITSEERKRLRLWLKDFRIHITGHRDWNEAIITRGGVDLKEVNPRTMESKLIPNLYFAGEILDLDADTGGYNLQAAFSTGYVAGNQV